MLNITNNISHFISDMYHQTSFEGLFEVYDKKIQALGFQGSLYAYIPTIYLNETLPTPPFVKISPSHNMAFLQHYHEAGFVKNDFTIKAIQQGRKNPIDWWVEEKHGTLTRHEKQVITIAKEEYAISNGISIPLMNEARGIAGASIISYEKPQSYKKLVAERRNELEIYAHIFHTHVMSSPEKHTLFFQPFLATLTDTEKKLLPFIVLGKPMKTLNVKNGMSHRYGEKCIKSIRTKFGNVTKGQLIYYIGVMHILDYL